ncbi:MAG: GNAT family N-acetyltransferase, partial [Rhizobiaceae bacterium]
SKRSLDKNIFFESEVLLSAWPRLTSVLAPQGCWMLCLWETTGSGRSLRLFMPTRINKVGFPKYKVLQPLSNEYMPIGTPLIDKDCSGEACETLLRLLSDPNLGLPHIIDFTHQRQTSESFKSLQEAALNLGLKTRQSTTQQRAALFSNQNCDDYIRSSLGAKRTRELNRQLRKLSEAGDVEFSVDKLEEDVLDAFEGFMTLELKGWKGRRGTALYNHKKIAAFSRQIVAELAMKNGCEIYTFKHNQQIIAALIMLGRDGHLVPWKMAYNEELGRYSPGMQLMVKATESLTKHHDFIEADSLAVQDHWMMNHIWTDRITVTDMAIALTPKADSVLDKAMHSKTRLLGIRAYVKKLLRG